MDWVKSVNECPSNKDGKCVVMPGDKTCGEHVENGTCPIARLKEKTDK